MSSMSFTTKSRHESKSMHEFVVVRSFPWRRYWAKHIDSLMLVTVTLFGWVLFGLPPYSTSIDFLFYFVLVSLIIVYETVALSKFQTTLGKSLLGVRAVNVTGRNMDLKDSFIRSCYCQFLGNAFYIPILSHLINIVAFYQLKNAETTLWDKRAKTKVLVANISVVRKIFAAVLILAFYFIVMTMLVLSNVNGR